MSKYIVYAFYQFLPVDDVVDLCTVLATHPAAIGQAFNCAPDPSPTWRQFLGGYKKIAGHNKWFGFPLWLAKVLAPLIDAGLTIANQPQDVQDLLDYASSQITFSTQKANDILGWKARTTLDEGMQHCEAWLREEGLL